VTNASLKKMNAFLGCVTRWMLATFWLFGALQQSESAIVCQDKPDDPKIVVLGVNSNAVSLNWKTCGANAGETITDFAFFRQRPGSLAREQIASRLASEGGFTMIAPFQDKKKYDARANQELKIFNVQGNDKYVYTLAINYTTNGGAFLEETFRATVDVKVPPKITVAPTREVQLSLSSRSVQNHTLICNASGDPHPNITWTKAGVPASQFNASGYLLRLVVVQREDAGSYICTASNGFGDNATAIGIVNIKCSDCKTERVGITIQGIDYHRAFGNQASVEFKALESNLLSAIWSTYADNPEKQLHRVDVAEFRSGSVYAVVELEFGSTGSDPLKPLTDELNDGKLGSFTVDRHLNPTIEPNTLSAPSRTTECD